MLSHAILHVALHSLRQGSGPAGPPVRNQSNACVSVRIQNSWSGQNQTRAIGGCNLTLVGTVVLASGSFESSDACSGFSALPRVLEAAFELFCALQGHPDKNLGELAVM